MMDALSENRTHRAISLLLVLTLHALLILALLRFMITPPASRMVPERHLFEMFISTARPPERGTIKKAPKPASARAATHRAPQTLVPAEPLPPAAPAPDIRGFGQALAGCAPENLASLDEVQRSRCRKFGASSSYDPGAVDYADHSDQVPGARQWERELARKNAPLLLPCGNARRADPVYTAACIIGNVANGFTFKKQYENQPAYFDKSGKSQ